MHIVAEVQRSNVDEFWAAAPEVKERVLAALGAAGVRSVVAHTHRKYGALPAGWTQLGNSSYAAYLFDAEPVTAGAPR